MEEGPYFLLLGKIACRRSEDKGTTVCNYYSISYNATMSGSLGDAFATNELGSEYVDGLYGYAMVLTRNRAEAEDLVQETYVRALGAVGRLRENSNVKGWLFTILRNLWFNELRKRRNAPAIVEMDGDDHTADSLAGNARDAHEIFVSNENSDIVRSAINNLPVEFREIILLREFEELSYQEIADVLGCPAGTVMSRLGRARAKLRTALADMWSVPGRSEKRNQS
ncbi:MAG: polymerase, sigma-24 subunit, subfamily [Edaphobacter sp.]|nr:polymerase, sigma-24 subunit, subfamily [Edaphobacter sp.]